MYFFYDLLVLNKTIKAISKAIKIKKTGIKPLNLVRIRAYLGFITLNIDMKNI